MRVETSDIKIKPERFIYWIQITFFSDNNSKKSIILAAASYEYLDDYYSIESHHNLEEKHLNDWVQRIINKWNNFGDKIFDHPIHFDPYANTNEGEANITDFLVNEIKAK